LAPDPAGADPGAAAAGGGGSSGSNMLITILPFGAGQFQNHAYLLGGAFLVAEAGALYYWQSKTAASSAAASQANAYVAANCDPNTASNDQLTACNSYVASSRAYVNGLTSQAQYGLIGFGALWVVGVAEAILDEPTPEELRQEKSGKKKKKKKDRKYAGFAWNTETRDYQLVDLPEERNIDFMAFDWHVGMLPTGGSPVDHVRDYSYDRAYDPAIQSPASPEKLEPSLNLSLRWSF
jgi:hypothetical protein